VSMPSELDREFQPCERTVAETIQRTEKSTPSRSNTTSCNVPAVGVDLPIAQ